MCTATTFSSEHLTTKLSTDIYIERKYFHNVTFVVLFGYSRRLMKKKEAHDLVSGINFSYITPQKRDKPIDEYAHIN